MPRRIAFCLTLAALVGTGLMSSPVRGQAAGPRPSATIPEGAGTFTFVNTQGNADKPLMVYSYQPAALPKTAPVVFVMHGRGRGAQSACETWRPYAEHRPFLLLCPLFGEDDYSTRAYNQGNLLAKDGTHIPQEQWTLSVIEPMFDHVKRLTGNTSTQYYLYGHSAGAQFVHRLVLFLPAARYAKAIAANAGSYTFPTFTGPAYPYGLRGTAITPDGLTKALGRPLLILLGEEDTDPHHPDLNNAEPAKAQGKHRLERGRNFHKAAAEAAAHWGADFRWALQTVPGADHSQKKMVASAAYWLFR